MSLALSVYPGRAAHIILRSAVLVNAKNLGVRALWGDFPPSD